MPYAALFEITNRLSDATRALAQRSLDGEFAKTLVNADFTRATMASASSLSLP